MSIKILPRKGLDIQLPIHENMIFCPDLSDISLGSFIALHIHGVSPLSMHGLYCQGSTRNYVLPKLWPIQSVEIIRTAQRSPFFLSPSTAIFFSSLSIYPGPRGFSCKFSSRKRARVAKRRGVSFFAKKNFKKNLCDQGTLHFAAVYTI